MAAIEYLVQQRVALRIEAIRVSASGVVKIGMKVIIRVRYDD